MTVVRTGVQSLRAELRSVNREVGTEHGLATIEREIQLRTAILG